jgi:hypothetical protein
MKIIVRKRPRLILLAGRRGAVAEGRRGGPSPGGPLGEIKIIPNR